MVVGAISANLYIEPTTAAAAVVDEMYDYNDIADKRDGCETTIMNSHEHTTRGESGGIEFAVNRWRWRKDPALEGLEEQPLLDVGQHLQFHQFDLRFDWVPSAIEPLH